MQTTAKNKGINEKPCASGGQKQRQQQVATMSWNSSSPVTRLISPFHYRPEITSDVIPAHASLSRFRYSARRIPSSGKLYPLAWHSVWPRVTCKTYVFSDCSHCVLWPLNPNYPFHLSLIFQTLLPQIMSRSLNLGEKHKLDISIPLRSRITLILRTHFGFWLRQNISTLQDLGGLSECHASSIHIVYARTTQKIPGEHAGLLK